MLATVGAMWALVTNRSNFVAVGLTAKVKAQTRILVVAYSVSLKEVDLSMIMTRGCLSCEKRLSLLMLVRSGSRFEDTQVAADNAVAGFAISSPS